MPRESKRARIQRMHEEYALLVEAFPHPKCALDFTSPLQLLIATVLSAQTTDKQLHEIKAAAFEGKFIAANQIDVLASLPTRDEAISQLMSVIQGATSKLARTLAAIRDQKEAAAA